MSKFYDDLGNMRHPQIAEFAGEIGRRTSQLMDELLADGMTIVEGRAIGSYLESQIDTSVLMALMQHQCKLGGSNEGDQSDE